MGIRIEGNEKTDELAKIGSQEIPEADINLGIPENTVQDFINDWIRIKHYCESVPKQAYLNRKAHIQKE